MRKYTYTGFKCGEITTTINFESNQNEKGFLVILCKEGQSIAVTASFHEVPYMYLNRLFALEIYYNIPPESRSIMIDFLIKSTIETAVMHLIDSGVFADEPEIDYDKGYYDAIQTIANQFVSDGKQVVRYESIANDGNEFNLIFKNGCSNHIFIYVSITEGMIEFSSEDSCGRAYKLLSKVSKRWFTMTDSVDEKVKRLDQQIRMCLEIMVSYSENNKLISIDLKSNHYFYIKALKFIISKIV